MFQTQDRVAHDPSFHAYLQGFGMPIVSGVAKERKRTRPRPQKHVNVHQGSVAVGDRLYLVRRRDMGADLESGWVRSMGSFVRCGSFSPLPTLAEQPHQKVRSAVTIT